MSHTRHPCQEYLARAKIQWYRTSVRHFMSRTNICSHFHEFKSIPQAVLVKEGSLMTLVSNIYGEAVFNRRARNNTISFGFRRDFSFTWIWAFVKNHIFLFIVHNVYYTYSFALLIKWTLCYSVTMYFISLTCFTVFIWERTEHIYTFNFEFCHKTTVYDPDFYVGGYIVLYFRTRDPGRCFKGARAQKIGLKSTYLKICLR